MLQGCQRCREEEEELAIKKIALSQATCVFYMMTDRHLIDLIFLVLKPAFSFWRVILKRLNHSEKLHEIWTSRDEKDENLSVVIWVIHRNKILSYCDPFFFSKSELNWSSLCPDYTVMHYLKFSLLGEDKNLLGTVGFFLTVVAHWIIES